MKRIKFYSNRVKGSRIKKMYHTHSKNGKVELFNSWSHMAKFYFHGEKGLDKNVIECGPITRSEYKQYFKPLNIRSKKS